MEIYAAPAKTGLCFTRNPVMMKGRIKLLHYYRQQNTCHTYHRYGNMGDRSPQSAIN